MGYQALLSHEQNENHKKKCEEYESTATNEYFF